MPGEALVSSRRKQEDNNKLHLPAVSPRKCFHLSLFETTMRRANLQINLVNGHAKPMVFRALLLAVTISRHVRTSFPHFWPYDEVASITTYPSAWLQGRPVLKRKPCVSRQEMNCVWQVLVLFDVPSHFKKAFFWFARVCAIVVLHLQANSYHEARSRTTRLRSFPRN